MELKELFILGGAWPVVFIDHTDGISLIRIAKSVMVKFCLVNFLSFPYEIPLTDLCRALCMIGSAPQTASSS